MFNFRKPWFIAAFACGGMILCSLVLLKFGKETGEVSGLMTVTGFLKPDEVTTSPEGEFWGIRFQKKVQSFPLYFTSNDEDVEMIMGVLYQDDHPFSFSTNVTSSSDTFRFHLESWSMHDEPDEFVSQPGEDLNRKLVEHMDENEEMPAVIFRFDRKNKMVFLENTDEVLPFEEGRIYLAHTNSDYSEMKLRHYHFDEIPKFWPVEIRDAVNGLRED